jgi:hypothetical protein
MGLQRVRLLISKGEQLPAPSAAVLQQLAEAYAEQAAVVEEQLRKQRQLKKQRPDGDAAEDNDVVRCLMPGTEPWVQPALPEPWVQPALPERHQDMPAA